MILQPLLSLAGDGGHGAAGEHHSSACAHSQGWETLLETAPEPCWDAPSLGTMGCESTKGLQPPPAPGSHPTLEHPWYVWCLSRHPSCTAVPSPLLLLHLPSQL